MKVLEGKSFTLYPAFSGVDGGKLVNAPFLIFHSIFEILSYIERRVVELNAAFYFRKYFI